MNPLWFMVEERIKILKWICMHWVLGVCVCVQLIVITKIKNRKEHSEIDHHFLLDFVYDRTTLLEQTI